MVSDIQKPTLLADVVVRSPSTNKRKPALHAVTLQLKPDHVILYLDIVAFLRIDFVFVLLSPVEWGQKAKRRRTTGTGRMRYLKDLPRRAKNGFQEGGVAKKKSTASA